MTDQVVDMKVPVKRFREILVAASTDPTRANLNGVCIDRGHDGSLRLVATDGHIMSIRRFPDIPCPEELKEKVISRLAIETWLLHKQKYTTLHGDESNTFTGITFPAWFQVIPSNIDFTRCSMTTFDPDLLIRLRKSSGSFSKKSVNNIHKMVSVFGKVGTDPHIVLTEDKDWLGIVMPSKAIREDLETFDIKGFLP